MISGAEIIIILILVVLLFGPNKIPELARNIGKFMGEFTKAQREVEYGFRSQFQSLSPQTPHNTQTSSNNEKIRQMAGKFGIDVEGKTDDELLDEIESKLNA